jgi:hypothetical protein
MDLASQVNVVLTTVNIVLVALFFYLENQKRLGRSLSASITISFNQRTTPQISKIVLTNHKERAVAIHGMHVETEYRGNAMRIPLAIKELPIVISGFESRAISPQEISAFMINGYFVNLSDLFHRKCVVKAVIDGKEIACRQHRSPLPDILQTHDYRVLSERSIFNGITYGLDHKYGFLIKKGDAIQSCIMTHNGFIHAQDGGTYSANVPPGMTETDVRNAVTQAIPYASVSNLSTLQTIPMETYPAESVIKYNLTALSLEKILKRTLP